MNDTVWIYAMSCPLTYQVKYVGKSKNPTLRFKTHLQNGGGTSNSDWLLDLGRQGVKPTLEYLERVPESRGFEAEGKWIRLLKEHGHDLTNKIYKGAKRPDVTERWAEKRGSVAI